MLCVFESQYCIAVLVCMQATDLEAVSNARLILYECDVTNISRLALGSAAVFK